MMIKRIVGLVIVVGLVVFGLIQLVPYGRDHANPAVISEPNWDSPATRDLAVRACFDCHSNETIWPWYSKIAPMSWLVQRDVAEGREVLNFSTWGRGEQEAEEIGEVIREGEMPPSQYVLLHPGARLTNAEQDQLINGLAHSLGASFEEESGNKEDDD